MVQGVAAGAKTAQDLAVACHWQARRNQDVKTAWDADVGVKHILTPPGKRPLVTQDIMCSQGLLLFCKVHC